MRKVLPAFGLLLGCILSMVYAGDYVGDWKAYVNEVDDTYPFFELKGIKNDWEKTKSDLEKRVKNCKDGSEFLDIINQSIKCLRDGHMGLVETKVTPANTDEPETILPLSFMPGTDNGVVVMSTMRRANIPGIRPGTVITKIDGQPARKYLDQQSEQLWKTGGYFSSPQRAAYFTWRMPLASAKATVHQISYLDNGKERKTGISNNQPYRMANRWAYNMPDNLLQAGGDCAYCALPSGIGYLYIGRIRGNETTEGVNKSVAALPEAKGWIIDLRGNGGGGYDEKLMEAFSKMSRPVAVITDAGCVSAGETVVRDLKKACDATIFGATTAGASSSKKTWEFPSGIAKVRMSTRSRFDSQGMPIEFNGISPDIEVEAVPEEVQTGKNSEILRAEEYLLKEKS